MNKIFKDMVEYLNDHDYFKFEHELLQSFKKYHGIEDLYFYISYGWFHCSDTDPRKNHNLWPTDISTGPHEILMRLVGTKSEIFFDSQRFKNLEDLKHYYLTKKLAGI